MRINQKSDSHSKGSCSNACSNAKEFYRLDSFSLNQIHTEYQKKSGSAQPHLF